MKLLALDTAMAACSVAVIDTDLALPLAEAFLAMERGHAEALAPMVQQAMAEAGLNFNALDRVAVTTGPGTFTGVRIGLAMARGLGLALGIPVVGIDTLSAIAANAGSGALVLVAADARKGEVYAALYSSGGAELRPPAVVPVAAAMADIPRGSLVIGTAADALIAASGLDCLIRSRAGDLPVAANFARLAAALPQPVAMPAPLYLRAPDAKPQTASVRSPAALQFRAGTALDAALFAELYAECFDNPWDATAFAQLMAMPGAAPVIAIETGIPVAFALLRQAADEVEIITIGTRPFARQRGVAKAMLDHQFTELLPAGAATAFLEVARSNVAAQALYRSCGFSEAGVRSGYYERHGSAREDAIVMRKVLAR